jgi:hypothetical protein
VVYSTHNVLLLLLLLAGNLPSGIAERDLEDEFIRFGTLRSVWIARKPPGFGAHRRATLLILATRLSRRFTRAQLNSSSRRHRRQHGFSTLLGQAEACERRDSSAGRL